MFSDSENSFVGKIWSEIFLSENLHPHDYQLLSAFNMAKFKYGSSGDLREMALHRLDKNPALSSRQFLWLDN